ncbi:hypothetical protein ERO13_A05G368600v2 [Gossypium hirsutum]|uniref:Transmembrane emp24 domain-containing protein p24delta9 n=7 Tax=Gossypium TaxID=3633 RepID=A0A1U8NL49_GOSHI|nr:transmembrane emp24 domain-containing protein p24delta9-like [Gossypium hirsutum]XP_052883243.1 transmembrane emp24 domain-containing protein p24delta9-like isoform X1 [Gossypium arboreum]KAB2085235.1 hypothetical protein ES319_A05G388000v1 [Gossypium barbadense]TYH20205.1 hypothetical protein ES288_A05G412900v1 [Gossypium darwinii]TYI30838.1 hypothetical protein ES332_A05G414800v1 [Gossypium tomentosum]KAG4202924.1 hypothetical protein ERO13_A05G368600v2 [Gossypium hirsutum]
MCGLNLGLIVIMIGLVVETETGESMRFELDSGKTKCIAEDIKANAMTVGKYSIVNPSEGQPFPDSHKLVVRVSSPKGNNYHLGDQVDSGTFAFTAAESGDYTTCFWANKHKPPVKMTIEFDWKSGVAAKDWSKVATKGQVETMEIELKKLYDTVSAIHEEMFYLRERDEEMQELNKETNSKMATLSFFSLLLCLSVAGLQIWHLKSFFERKKLL